MLQSRRVLKDPVSSIVDGGVNSESFKDVYGFYISLQIHYWVEKVIQQM